MCSTGTCEYTFDVCGEDAGSCAPAAQTCIGGPGGGRGAGIIGGECSITGAFCNDDGDCPALSQECVDYEDNCHERALCPCDENDDGDCDDDGEDSEGLCFVPPGSAGSSRQCRGARRNDCYVNEPASCNNP